MPESDELILARTEVPGKGRRKEPHGKRRRSSWVERMMAQRPELSEVRSRERLIPPLPQSGLLYCSCEGGRWSGCGCFPRWGAAMRARGSEKAVHSNEYVK